MTYEEMIAGRGMKVGDQVVCDYRIPTMHQCWTAPFWVGVIEPASTEAKSYGSISEAQFCSRYQYVKVRYLDTQSTKGFTQFDQIGHIRQLHFGDVEYSPVFIEPAKMWEFACKCGMADQLARTPVQNVLEWTA